MRRAIALRSLIEHRGYCIGVNGEGGTQRCNELRGV